MLPKYRNRMTTEKEVNNNLSWIEKDRLAGIRLNEIMALAAENSILYEVSSKVLRELIVEGIDIGLDYTLHLE